MNEIGYSPDNTCGPGKNRPESLQKRGYVFGG